MLEKDTIKKLRKVLAYIEQEPKRLVMGVWGFKVDKGAPADTKSIARSWLTDDGANHTMPPCGTASCLAGSAMLVLGTKQEVKKLFVPDEHYAGLCTLSPRSFSDEIPRLAANKLGLSHQQATTLFYPNNWPTYYGDLYSDAKSSKRRFKALQLLVEDFIAVHGKIGSLFDKGHERQLKAEQKKGAFGVTV